MGTVQDLLAWKQINDNINQLVADLLSNFDNDPSLEKDLELVKELDSKTPDSFNKFISNKGLMEYKQVLEEDRRSTLKFIELLDGEERIRNIVDGCTSKLSQRPTLYKQGKEMLLKIDNALNWADRMLEISDERREEITKIQGRIDWVPSLSGYELFDYTGDEAIKH